MLLGPSSHGKHFLKVRQVKPAYRQTPTGQHGGQHGGQPAATPGRLESCGARQVLRKCPSGKAAPALTSPSEKLVCMSLTWGSLNSVSIAQRE